MKEAIIFNMLDNWLTSNKSNLSGDSILVDVNEKYGNDKQIIGLSFKDKTATIELISSGTIDFTIFSADGESIIYTKTLDSLNDSALVSELNLFYSKLK